MGVAVLLDDYRNKKRAKLDSQPQTDESMVFMEVCTDESCKLVVKHICMICGELKPGGVFSRSLLIHHCFDCEKYRLLDVRALKMWAFNKSVVSIDYTSMAGREFKPIFDPYAALR